MRIAAIHLLASPSGVLLRQGGQPGRSAPGPADASELAGVASRLGGARSYAVRLREGTPRRLAAEGKDAEASPAEDQRQAAKRRHPAEPARRAGGQRKQTEGEQHDAGSKAPAGDDRGAAARLAPLRQSDQ